MPFAIENGLAFLIARLKLDEFVTVVVLIAFGCFTLAFYGATVWVVCSGALASMFESDSLSHSVFHFCRKLN